MNLLEVELKLPLGDFLFNEVRRMASSMDMREDQKAAAAMAAV